jgi:hypothetical protein
LTTPSAGGVTALLRAWSDDNEATLDQLMRLVEAELRRLARGYMRRERRGHTLQTTALVNEAFLRLTNAAPWDGRITRTSWESRRASPCCGPRFRSVTTAECDLCGDRFTGWRVLAKADRMEELVNHDDLRSHPIAHGSLDELLPTDVNDRRAGLCEGQNVAGAALWCRPAVDKPQGGERL